METKVLSLTKFKIRYYLEKGGEMLLFMIFLLVATLLLDQSLKDLH